MGVVHFDQRLGAACSKSWLNYTSSMLFEEKAEKRKKTEKNFR